MFESVEEKPEEQKPTNYTGVIIGAAMLPVFLLFRHFGRVDLALPAFIYGGMILLAIGICWDSRARLWFWAVIIFVLVLHVFLLLKVPWPHFKASRISVLPIALVDLLGILGIIKFVQKFVVREAPADEEE